MIPNWMKEKEEYTPIKDSGNFIRKSIDTIGTIMSRLKIQQGHEKKHAMPAVIKLLLLVFVIVLLSVSHNVLLILAIAAVVNGYLCMWPAGDIWSVMKSAGLAGILAFILFLPAMIMNPEGIINNVLVIVKVFVSVEMVNIFNHTTQWNHITKAFRKLHIPSVFVFVLDITLKYIVILGSLTHDLLVSLNLRSVGKNNKKYQSIGGVMGVTFIRSTEMSKETYEAMRCRGFTDDYKGL